MEIIKLVRIKTTKRLCDIWSSHGV